MKRHATLGEILGGEQPKRRRLGLGRHVPVKKEESVEEPEASEEEDGEANPKNYLIKVYSAQHLKTNLQDEHSPPVCLYCHYVNTNKAAKNDLQGPGT